MGKLTTDLKDRDGNNVISISVARQHMFRRDCRHLAIDLDEMLAHVYCRDCGKEVNAVQWIAMAAEEWHRVQHLYELQKNAAEVMAEKQKTQCQFCKRITRVNPPTAFSRKMRERGHVV